MAMLVLKITVVLALGPDIVGASTFLPPASARAFARLGIEVESVGAPSTVADSVKARMNGDCT